MLFSVRLQLMQATLSIAKAPKIFSSVDYFAACEFGFHQR